jgi:hypothetical protein
MTTSHALVVLDLPLLARATAWEDTFEWSLRLVQLAESARVVFPTDETICQVSPRRLVVMASRDDLLAPRVGLLRTLVEDVVPENGRARVWIEGLPSSDDSAGLLLGEIART